MIYDPALLAVKMPDADKPRWSWSCAPFQFGCAARWEAALHFSAWPYIFRNPGGSSNGVKCASYFQLIGRARYWRGGSKSGEPDADVIRANYDDDRPDDAAPICLWRSYMQRTEIRGWFKKMARGELEPLWPKMWPWQHLAACGAPKTIVREAYKDPWIGVAALRTTDPSPEEG